uniref:Uncharacterized protein n=1 Tax=Ditylenchus dipsaci TaxID=166011 RepID=A0A915D7G0_9BILA
MTDQSSLHSSPTDSSNQLDNSTAAVSPVFFPAANEIPVVVRETINGIYGSSSYGFQPLNQGDSVNVLAMYPPPPDAEDEVRIFLDGLFFPVFRDPNRPRRF